MEATKKQKQLAETIDTWIKNIEKKGGGDDEILADSLMHMPIFKEILDSSTHEQMISLSKNYSGFFRFAKLLENLAQGIKDGTINVPSVN